MPANGEPAVIERRVDGWTDGEPIYIYIYYTCVALIRVCLSATIYTHKRYKWFAINALNLHRQQYNILYIYIILYTYSRIQLQFVHDVQTDLACYYIVAVLGNIQNTYL